MDWQDFTMDIMFWGIPSLGLVSVIAREIREALSDSYRKGITRESDGKIVLRLPSFLRWIAVLALLMVLTIIVGDIYSSFQKGQHFVFPNVAILCILALVSISPFGILIYCRNHRVVLNEHGIVYFGLFKQKREYPWTEITMVDFSQSAFFLYKQKKYIGISFFLSGFELFVESMKKNLSEDLYKEALRKYELYTKRI